MANREMSSRSQSKEVMAKSYLTPLPHNTAGHVPMINSVNDPYLMRAK